MERTKILVVDDNSLSRSILKRLFEKEYEVLEAENGKQALDLFQAHEDSLAAVLLDLLMPQYDGMYFLEHSESRRLAARIPVICISGDERESSLIRAYLFHVDSFIAKPFNTDLVRRVVHNAVHHPSERAGVRSDYDNMTMITRLMTVLNRCHDNTDVFQTALAIVGAYLDADRVSLYMKPMQSPVYQWRRKGVEDSYRQTYNWMLEHDWCRDWSLPEEWLLYVGPEHGSYKQYAPYFRQFGIRAMECLKIEGIRNDGAYLLIENPGHEAQELTLMSTIQNCFSLAVKTVELGIVDQKTGVYNRKLYSDYMQRLTYTPLNSLGVIVMNLNSMHQYIATYGQSAGDELLERTADLICRCMGSTCFRTGGDEFTAILRNGSREETEQLMERISLACREQNIGLSLGYDWSDRNIDPEDLYKTADRNMRAAKKKHYSSLNVTNR